MKKFFGTDGIRGIANSGVMTADVVMKLGAALGSIFKKNHARHKAIIGKDTRLSGYLIESAITAGLISTGIDVLLVGPMPTPSISMLTKSLRADFGVVISASHNPFQYNGIKIFDSKGLKLSIATEEELEALVMNYPNNISFAEPKELGKAIRLEDAPGRYIEFAKNTFPKGRTLNGMKLVIDSANGSAYHLVKNVFWELGAEVIQIANTPNGFNINENCGSIHPEVAAAAVLEHKADLGIVLDGDADRALLIDETGTIINGDQMLSVIALYMKKTRTLFNNTVVSTCLSNLGFEKYLQSNGIKLIRTEVGDKHVMKVMHEGGYTLGGERSGHIIMSDYCFSGDGIISSLQVLAAFIESGNKKLSKMFDGYEEVPQISFNINCSNFISNEVVTKLNDKYSKKLSDTSRMLIRKSGTEPLVRVMIESACTNTIKKLASEIKTELSCLIS